MSQKKPQTKAKATTSTKAPVKARVKPKAKVKPPAKVAAKKAPKKPGRPTAFTEAISLLICERLAQGESLVNICKDEKLPARGTVMRWLQEDRHTGFRDNYARAREAQADFYAEEIIGIADEECTYVKHGDGDEARKVEVAFDSAAVARNRLRVDARKWYASKVAPKKYGEKIAVGGAEDLPPVLTRTMTDAETAVHLAAILSQAGK